MKELKLKTFTLDHIDKFNCRDLNWDTVYSEGLLAMPMLTLFAGEDIICIFGLREIHEGVAEGFLYGDHRISKYKKDFHGVTKKLPEFAMKKYNLHRLEVIVEERNKQWALDLGLELESTLRKFNPDKSNSYMFVRIE